MCFLAHHVFCRTSGVLVTYFLIQHAFGPVSSDTCFLVRHVFVTPSGGRLQPKQLRKLIQHTFKQYAPLSEEECVFQFFEVLAQVWRFDQERFKCALGVSTSTPPAIAPSKHTGQDVSLTSAMLN